ncbi:hypothetical protein [Deinococcus sp. RM]|uniref:hypothetical protein n=1 Tax=Deinococcus sp. RM TaxID=2316359 RepID=UPI003AB3F211
MDLPPHLQPFEALLPQEPGPARVDALLALSADPPPLPEQVALAGQARELAASLNDPARTARAELRLGTLQGGPEALEQVRSAARPGGSSSCGTRRRNSPARSARRHCWTTRSRGSRRCCAPPRWPPRPRTP